MRKPKRLNIQQVRFCHEYLVDGCGEFSAIRAGYRAKSALSKGHRLLKMPEVRAYIDELQAELREKYKATAERVIYELGLVAFADFGDYVTYANEVKDLQYIPEHKRRAVSSISVTHSKNMHFERTNIQLKMHDKAAALKLLGKHLGIFEKPVQITNNQIQTISINTNGVTNAEANQLNATQPVLERATENILPQQTETAEQRVLEVPILVNNSTESPELPKK